MQINQIESAYIDIFNGEQDKRYYKTFTDHLLVLLFQIL